MENNTSTSKKHFWENKYFKALLIIGFVLVVPYLAITALILWGFFIKSNLPKKTKKIVGISLLGLTTLILGGIFILYTNDTDPHLVISEPADTNTSIKGTQITIKGTYEPIDSSIWVNDERISASDGVFETTYSLKIGENHIDIKAGNWKSEHAYLTVTRELTEEEKTAQETERAAQETERAAQEAEKAPVVEEPEDQVNTQPEPDSVEQEQPVEEEVEAVGPVANYEDDIKKVLNDHFGGDNNRDVPYLEEVRINENVLESTADTPVYIVSVFFNASDNLTNNMLKEGMKSDISRIYKILYTNNLPIFDVWVFAHFPMVDKYGNTSDSLVHKSNLDKTTADKVNWDYDDATLRFDIIPGVWETHKNTIDL